VKTGIMHMTKTIKITIACLMASISSLSASTLANPAVLIPPARIAFGVSYNLEGISLTNREVPSMFNRVQGRISFSPFSYLNIGLDAGASQIEIASDTTTTDTISVFHGKYGFSGGGHIKLGTPFFFDNLVSIIGIANGSYFASKNEEGTLYSGFDGNGGIGLQFHVPTIGYFTAGTSVYLIEGKNKSYNGVEGVYSNVNNVRGWLALDYFPPEKMGSKNTFYLSLEVFASPKVAFNERVPVQEFGFSISVGSISQRLFGQETALEWKP
jgi:hypothetical protein